MGSINYQVGFVIFLFLKSVTIVKSSSVQKMKTKRSPSVLGRLPNLTLMREGHAGQPGDWKSPAFAWRCRAPPAVSQKL